MVPPVWVPLSVPVVAAVARNCAWTWRSGRAATKAYAAPVSSALRNITPPLAHSFVFWTLLTRATMVASPVTC